MSGAPEGCMAPGCHNLTTLGICDDCDQWVTDEVAKLGQSDDAAAAKPPTKEPTP